jgi:hypothetical protein
VLVEHQHGAVAILQAGRVDHGTEHQAEGVDEKMALLALDLLARIGARRVDRGPLFPRFSRSGYRSRRRSERPRGPRGRGS